MFRCLVVALLVLLAGCVSFQQLETGLENLMGKDQSVAFSVLGRPTEYAALENGFVYYWEVDRVGALRHSREEKINGWLGSTRVKLKSRGRSYVPVHYNCSIILVADAQYRLRYWEFSGNILGCERYIKEVDRFSRHSVSN